MDGIKLGSFFSYINMAGSAAYKAVSKIETLGQRVSSYIRSFFASNHSQVNPELEMQELGKTDLQTDRYGNIITKKFSKTPFYTRDFRVSKDSLNIGEYAPIEGITKEVEALLMFTSSTIV